MKFDLAKAAASRCVLIKGSDGMLVAQAMADLVKSHKEAHEAAPDVVTADSAQPSDWIGMASSASFFSEVQVVVVRNLGRQNPAKLWTAKEGKAHPFAGLAASLPDFARLILVGDEESGTPERQAAAKEACDRWAKLVDAGGGYVASLEIDPKNTASLVSEEAKKRGLSLSSSAAQKLSLMVGGQAGLALAELDKTALYACPRTKITEADLEAVVMPEPDYNIFQLAEAVVRGDSGRALRELEVASNVPAASYQGEAIGRILPAIHRQVKLVWQARLCIDARCSPANPPEEVLRQFPDRPALHKEREWIQNKAMNMAQGVGLPALAGCLQELARADSRLKGLLPAYSAKETMESMVLAMASLCRS